MSGRVVHFEIPFGNGDQAREFYQRAFGWNVVPVPEMEYTLVSTGPTAENGPPAEAGFINGGLMQRSDPFQGPVLVVDVDDIDTALAKIEGLGGKIVRPRMDVGDMGFAAYFTDTEGNLMGLWQNAPTAE